MCLSCFISKSYQNASHIFKNAVFSSTHIFGVLATWFHAASIAELRFSVIHWQLDKISFVNTMCCHLSHTGCWRKQAMSEFYRTRKRKKRNNSIMESEHKISMPALSIHGCSKRIIDIIQRMTIKTITDNGSKRHNF